MTVSGGERQREGDRKQEAVSQNERKIGCGWWGVGVRKRVKEIGERGRKKV